MGETGAVKVIFTVLKRKILPTVIGIIKRFNPNAFHTVEDVRFAKDTMALPMERRQLFSLRSVLKRK